MVGAFSRLPHPLLSFPVRRTAHQVDELLDPDFRKIGASGRLWTRAEMAGAVVGPELVLAHLRLALAGTTGQAQFALAAVSRLMAALPPGHPA